MAIALHNSIGASLKLLDVRIRLQTSGFIQFGSSSPLVFKAAFLTNSTLNDSHFIKCIISGSSGRETSSAASAGCRRFRIRSVIGSLFRGPFLN